jgi:drug/metabolite transporter (DMT)-like permease
VIAIAIGGRIANVALPVPRFLHLQLHALVALFATTAILGRLISLPATQLVVCRTGLATLGAMILAAFVLKRKLVLPVRQCGALLGIGAIVGLHWMCFFGAIRLANVSVCLTGLATISFFTAFTEPWFEKRPICRREVGLGVLVLAGLLMVAGFESGYAAGLMLALCGAFLAAVFPVLNRHWVGQQRLDPIVMIFWEMLGACVCGLVLLPWLGGDSGYAGLFQWRGLDWLWLLILAWVCTVFAHGFHIHLLRYLSAYTSNLAINIEPIYGMAAAALLFGEHRQLHPGFFLGAGTIVVANLLHAVLGNRKSALLRPEPQMSGQGMSD